MTGTLESSGLSLAERINEVIDGDKVQLPPLPELAVRLRDVLAREGTAARDVAELVHSDPAVAASLLRIANSAAFGGLRQVTDLGQAVARLGLKQVGSVVTTLLLKGHFTCERADKQGLLQSLWDHALAVAFISRRLAEDGEGDPEEAFLAGLLHDSGRLLILRAIDYLEDEGVEIEITHTVLMDLMEVLHPEVGHRALVGWKLPATLCDVALHHEQAPQEGQGPILTYVQAGDAISQKLGLHISPEPELNLLQDPAIEILGLSDIEVASLIVDLEDELEEIRGLF